MKIVSWNINGLRAVLKNRGQDLKAFLDSLNADIVCLQETKATRDQLDSSMCAAEGYSAFFSFCKTRSGYSGVVTFCNDSASPIAAEEGLTGVLSDGKTDHVGCYPDWDPDALSTEELTALDAEGRAVITEHKCELVGDDGREGREPGEGEPRRVVVVNVYCPMVVEENMERLEYKLQFYTALQERCSQLMAAGKLVLAVGDFNCSRQPIDSAYIQDYPDLVKNSPAQDYLLNFLISDPSSSSEVKTGGSRGLVKLVDVFRFLHPAQKSAYTCWSTIMECRKTNYGTRIDYITACPELAVGAERSEVWQQEEGSDHCPVFAEFSLRTFPSAKLPSLCSCNFPELSNKQKKLSAFLIAKPKKQEGAGGGGSRDETITGSSSSKILKRSASATRQVPPPAKLRKTCSQPAAKSSRNKASAFFFSKPTSKAETERDSQSTGSQLSAALVHVGDTQDEQSGSSSTPATLLPKLDPSADAQPSVLSDAWKGVFGAPPKPPLCKGHREPCKLMTVKKAGPNKSRQFWRCARPGGSKGDPEANCDFFQWASKK